MAIRSEVFRTIGGFDFSGVQLRLPAVLRGDCIGLAAAVQFCFRCSCDLADLLVLPGAVDKSPRHSIVFMADRQAVGRMETENLRAYLTINDINILMNKPFLHIPYPDAEC